MSNDPDNRSLTLLYQQHRSERTSPRDWASILAPWSVI